MIRVCAYCKLGQHEDCLSNQGMQCSCEECRIAPDAKPVEKFVYGLDPASKNDYFGIVVHSIGEYDPAKPYLPELRTLRNITHLPFDRMLEILRHELFPKYPPAFMVIDYQNEKTFTDMLIRDYGDYRVEGLLFSSTNKKMLKDDGYSIIKQGYKFPNPALIKNKQIAQWVTDLTNQLLREQLIIKQSGRETFDKPQGEHNDLAIAWELSIHGCLKYILKKGSQPIADSINPELDRNYYPSADDMFPELQKYSNVATSYRNP